MFIPAYIKYLAISTLFLIAAINFTKTTLSIIESSRRYDETKEEVLALETERTSLEKELEYRKSDDFVEEKARNDLNLVKPGERVYVLSDDIANKVDQVKQIVKEEETSNFGKWIDLFF